MKTERKKKCMPEKMISVIVPTYNSINKVNKLLDSIKTQEYNNFEIIFVDDGSDDGTYDFLKQMSKSNGKIRAYKKEHAGPGPARKFGYSKSAGQLLVFIDSDDWFHSPSSFSTINELFLNDDIDICLTPRLAFPTNELLEPFKETPMKVGVYNLDIFKYHQIRGSMGVKIFKRELLTEDMFVGSYNYEDMLTTIRYLDVCKKVFYTDKIIQVYNKDDSNKSLTHSKDYLKKTMLERDYNILETIDVIKSKPLLCSLANLAFSDYCKLLLIDRHWKKNAKMMRDFENVVFDADLSGYYHLYPRWKRLVLWIVKHKRINNR